jgi:hypothetical protein
MHFVPTLISCKPMQFFYYSTIMPIVERNMEIITYLVKLTVISGTRFFKHIVHFPCIWQIPIISYYVDYMIDMRFSADSAYLMKNMGIFYENR